MWSRAMSETRLGDNNVVTIERRLDDLGRKLEEFLEQGDERNRLSEDLNRKLSEYLEHANERKGLGRLLVEERAKNLDLQRQIYRLQHSLEESQRSLEESQRSLEESQRSLGESGPSTPDLQGLNRQKLLHLLI